MKIINIKKKTIIICTPSLADVHPRSRMLPLPFAFSLLPSLYASSPLYATLFHPSSSLSPDYFSPSVLLFPANNLLSLPDRSSPPRENPRSIPLSWFLYHTPIVVAWQPPSLVRSSLRRAPSSSLLSSDQRLTVSRGTGSPQSTHRVPPAFTTSHPVTRAAPLIRLNYCREPAPRGAYIRRNISGTFANQVIINHLDAGKSPEDRTSLIPSSPSCQLEVANPCVPSSFGHQPEMVRYFLPLNCLILQRPVNIPGYRFTRITSSWNNVILDT